MGASSKEFFDVMSRDDCQGMDFTDWLTIVAAPLQASKGNEMNINDFSTGAKTLKAADLQGRTLNVTIADVTAMDFNEKGTMVKKPVLWFQGKEKGLVLNVTKRTILAQTYGEETDYWRGKQVCLRPTKTSYEGKIVDSIDLLPVTPTVGAPQQYVAPAPAPAAAQGYAAQQPPTAPPQEWRQNAPAQTGPAGGEFEDSDVPFN